MPKTINNYNRFLPVVHFSQTELEESLCNAVIYNDEKAAEIAIFELNISDNFTSDLRINKSYIDDTHNIFIGDSLPLVAVKNNNLDMLKMLLSCGFEPNTPATTNCYTPLWYASYKGNSVRKLLEYPINNINETFGKETPLKSALIHKHTEIAKLLIDKINPDKFLFNGVEHIAHLPHDQFISVINGISADKKTSLFKLCSKNITEHQDFILFGKSEVEKNNICENNTYMLDYLDNNHDDSMTIVGSID